MEPFFLLKARENAYNRLSHCSVDFFESSDFVLDCNHIKYTDHVAKGSYGTVYKALVGGEYYAVKTQEFHSGEQEQTNLLVELTILQSFPHERLVKFIMAGFQPTSDISAKCLLIMELCTNGDLRHNLKFDLGWVLKCRLLRDIAEGLSFLHENGIIHRDIKTTNILIDANFRAKICDFSFAIHDKSSSKCEYTYGTDEFMSPEIALALDFCTLSDIFSFGIITFEMCTGREPSSEFLCRKPQHMFAIDELEIKNAILDDCPNEMEQLGFLCCDVTPSKRPNSELCFKELSNIYDKLGGDDCIVVPDKSMTSVPSTDVFLDNLSTSREGNVQYPRSENLSRILEESHQWSSQTDSIHRLSSLEFQVQELKAENRRLSRDLYTLANISTLSPKNSYDSYSSPVERMRSKSVNDTSKVVLDTESQRSKSPNVTLNTTPLVMALNQIDNMQSELSMLKLSLQQQLQCGTKNDSVPKVNCSLDKIFPVELTPSSSDYNPFDVFTGDEVSVKESFVLPNNISLNIQVSSTPTRSSPEVGIEPNIAESGTNNTEELAKALSQFLDIVSKCSASNIRTKHLITSVDSHLSPLTSKQATGSPMKDGVNSSE